MSSFQNFLQALKEILGVAEQQEFVAPVSTQEEIKGQHFQESEGKTTPKAEKNSKNTYEKRQDFQPRPMAQNQEDVTIISKNTMVTGDMRSFEDMRVKGKVDGNIQTTKTIDVSGVINGDTIASAVALSGATIKGNVSSEGGVLIDKNSVMYGDVAAQNGKFDGKIKGNLAIGGEASFYANSVILGDILVSDVSVERGAKLKGYINTNVPDSLGEEFFSEAPGNPIFEDAASVSRASEAPAIEVQAQAPTPPPPVAPPPVVAAPPVAAPPVAAPPVAAPPVAAPPVAAPPVAAPPVAAPPVEVPPVAAPPVEVPPVEVPPVEVPPVEVPPVEVPPEEVATVYTDNSIL